MNQKGRSVKGIFQSSRQFPSQTDVCPVSCWMSVFFGVYTSATIFAKRRFAWWWTLGERRCSWHLGFKISRVPEPNELSLGEDGDTVRNIVALSCFGRTCNSKSKYFRFGFRFISYMYDVATFLTCVFVPLKVFLFLFFITISFLFFFFFFYLTRPP